VKLKPVFPQFVVPGAIALALAVGASVPPAHAGFIEWLGTNLIDLFAKLTALLAGVLADIVLPFLTGITESLIANPNFPVGSDAEGLWKVAITLANSFFLLALILASIAIMLRINTGTYNIKKVLGGFISAVVLSNLSFLVVKAMLDIGNSLLNAVYKLLNVEVVGVLGIIDSLAKIGDASKGHIWENHLEATIVFIVMVVLVIWVILSIAALLIERMIWLFLLTISAPVVFALGLLPTLPKLASSWWEQMIKWVIAFPYSIALLVIGGKIMGLGGAGKKDLGEIFQKFAGAVNNSPNDVGGAIMKLIDPALLLIICGMVVIYFAGRVPKMLKIGGGLTGITGAGPAGTWGAIKKGAEGVYKGVAQTATGKNLLGKVGHTAYYGGRRQLLAGSYNRVPLVGGLMKNLQKRMLAGEAWRQRQTAGPLAMILNPKERGKKMGTDIGRAVAFQTFAGDVQRVKGILKPLNAASQAAYGKDWYELDKTQQDGIIADPKLKANKTDLSDAYATMMWRARQFTKDIKISDYDPVPIMEQDLMSKAKSKNPTEVGEAVDIAVRLSEIAASRTNAENKTARELLTRPNIIKILREDLGLNIKKLFKGEVGPSVDLEDKDFGGEGAFAGGVITTGAAPTAQNTDEQMVLANRSQQNAAQKLLAVFSQEQIDRTAKGEIGASQVVRPISGAARANLDAITQGALSILNGTEGTGDLIDQLSSEDVTERTPARDQLIKINAGRIDDNQLNAVIDLASSTGMSLGEITLRKNIEAKAATDGKNIGEFLTEVKSQLDDLQKAQSNIDEMRDIHMQEATTAADSYGRTIKAYIERTVEGTQYDPVDVQAQLTQQLNQYYETVMTRFEEGNRSESLARTTIDPAKWSEITRTLDNLDLGRVDEMNKKATLGDISAMLRKGRDVTAKLQFGI
jgi:hypothetical protein